MMENASQPPLIELRGISKYFGPVRALENVNLVVNRRQVVGLVGDNGAGKSTLMKILTGAYQPTFGEILLEGRPVHFASPHESRLAGIEMVYQDLALAGNLSIAANIYLGREPIKRQWGLFRFMDEKRIENGSRELLERLKINIPNVKARVENLSGGQRQSVAIARATAFNAKLVIMDEPTAALAVKEVAKVLETVLNLRAHGVAVILISHRMQDVMSVADRIIVLYEGAKVADLERSKTNLDEIVAYIVGSKGSAAQARAVAEG
ncbi:MAG: sugar ABC transporter ATP-binding protein [Chloroflexi bacterium]|nr:sugar ABC transporter ATP-binding protein [Chloroflexota bacterium]